MILKVLTGKKSFINSLVLVVIITAFYLFPRLLTNEPTQSIAGTKLSPLQLENFAKYLNRKGVKMYGAYWCSHCQNQKKLFGGAFKYINYVECTREPSRCLAAGIKGYPTWTIPDNAGESGRKTDGDVAKIEGETTLEKLARATGYNFTPVSQ